MTAEERSERARAAARARWAKADAEERAAQGRRGQAGLVAKLAREVEDITGGELDDAERAELVQALRSAHMSKLSRRHWWQDDTPG